MPRKRPADVRRANQPPTPVEAPLPTRVRRHLDRLDNPVYEANQVSLALRSWQRLAELSRHMLAQPDDDLITYIGPQARDLIDQAVCALPDDVGRQLAARVRPWDELYRSKTVPNPFASLTLGWWRRRYHD